MYDATSAFVTHRDVGWKCKSPDEGTSPSLAQNVVVILAEERGYFARDHQPIVEHLDSDLVSRDAGDFEGGCYRVRHRILKNVHSTISNRVRNDMGENTDRKKNLGLRTCPCLEASAT
jgi:hypothetical protein